MKMNKQDMISILEVFLYGSLIYFGELLMYKSLFSLYETKSPGIVYLMPIIVTILFTLPVSIAFKYSQWLYCHLYFISGVIHGLLLNMFLCSILYQILWVFTSISFNSGVFILIILPIVINIYGVINTFTIRITDFTLKYKGYSIGKGKKTTIAHLSDLHLGAVFQRKWVENIVDKLKKLSPDIVVITGDLADGSIKVQSKWIEPFNQLTMPILFISGNHEEIANKNSVLNEIAETNIKYIGGKNYMFKGINFIGVDYEENVFKRMKMCKEENNQTVPNVLLYHVPELYPKDLACYDIFLHLAGHTHGGQSIPVHLPTYFLNACFNGLYPDATNEHYVYVTSGVSTAVTPIRTCSKSEIALITIERC